MGRRSTTTGEGLSFACETCKASCFFFFVDFVLLLLFLLMLLMFFLREEVVRFELSLK